LHLDMIDLPSCTILIVEDDPCIAEMLQTILHEQGAEVVTASDGRGIPALVQQREPDIILLDVGLPYKDGISVLADLRAAAIDIPVIMLTERSQVEDKVHSLIHGADDYVTKPFSPQELLARIHALHRRSNSGRGGGSTRMTLGPIVMDVQTREVVFDGTPLNLTKTEFDLLHHLGRQADQVVAHGELLTQVLGYDPDSETKALVMHIANLRRKLDRAGGNMVRIVAVPAIGYRLLTHPTDR
jgi:DNA-binding response OmpR family regulator